MVGATGNRPEERATARLRDAAGADSLLAFPADSLTVASLLFTSGQE